MKINESDLLYGTTYIAKDWNDTDKSTGARVLHKPTKIAVECDLLPNQSKNRKKAIEWLEMILEMEGIL